MRETKMKKVLAVVLAFAMVLAMGVMTFAATEANPTLETVSNDGKTVVLSVKSTGPVTAFDFGVTYDSEKVSLTKSTWNSDFSAAYDDVSGIKAKNDQKDYSYIVLGGTAPDVTYEGEIATLEFAIADGATGDLGFSVCVDSADIKKAIDKAGDPKPLKDGEGFTSKSDVTTPATGVSTETEAPTQAPADQPTQAPADQPTQAPTGQDPAGQQTTAPAGQQTTAPVNTTTTAPTKAPTKASPKTGDTATVVIPMVAIVAAAAAVVVASKKKVED